LPTASGKTACLDIALYTLACQAALPPNERTAPRRVAFVVDRRVVVDEAFDRARRIARCLRTGCDPDGQSRPILAQVAEALRHIGGLRPDEEALAVAQLRSGIYRDTSWAANPAQPTMLASTVDQIGSRLLFRGYGVSDSLKPAHAGLVGNDCLILLDEAHCARPFAQTAAAVTEYRKWTDSHSLCAPFQFVVLSATPPADVPGDVFRLDDADLTPDALGPRILCAKPVDLIVEDVGGGAKGQEKFASNLVEHASRMVNDFGLRAIAILVNRVNTAYKVHELCRKRWPKADALCLTGRMRPYDRDAVLSEWKPRLRADKRRARLERPAFVTATQCLEVGANLDFEGMVTECASLDALRQRFGRLKRLGIGPDARGAILIRADQVKTEEEIAKEAEGKKDPIYGDALPRTWSWLCNNAEAVPADDGDQRRIVDFGIAALNRILPPAAEEIELLQAPTRNAPVMLPAHLDCWVQTAPKPDPDPDVALFLHGPDQGQAEVQVCWRADLELDLPADQKGDWWKNAVALCPPNSAECMPLPLSFVRQWLRDDPKGTSANDSDSDVEGSTNPMEPVGDDGEPSVRHVLRWRGPDDPATGLIDDPGSLRPGDTLVVPANEPWAASLTRLPDWYGTEPSGRDIDIAEQTTRISRRRAVLRLVADRFASWPQIPALETVKRIACTDADPRDERDELREALAELAAHPEFPDELRETADALATDRRFRIYPYPGRLPNADGARDRETDQGQSTRGLLIVGSKLLPMRDDRALADEIATSEDDTASATVSVPLDKHSEGVAEIARLHARSCGLPEDLCLALCEAARGHDLGKTDRRFQAWLHGGNSLMARIAPKVLAKSGGLPQSPRDRESARIRSGYPRGGRHELVSVRLMERLLDSAPQNFDRDLVLHLIASHHGSCRPLAPVVDEPEPIDVEITVGQSAILVSSDTKLAELDSGVAERFWTLVRRYGWWGLAFLETMLRLADHRRSALEQEDQIV
jgi:CRISPR-associated endonuclease/helicase Cas3